MDSDEKEGSDVQTNSISRAGSVIPIAEREILAKRIAGLLILDPNKSSTKLAQELGISRFQLKRITDSDYFKQIVAERADKDLQVAVNQARHALSRLLTEAVKTIEHHLQKRNLDAAKVVLRSAGLEEQQEKATDSTMNVYLPTGVKISVGDDARPVLEVKDDGTSID